MTNEASQTLHEGMEELRNTLGITVDVFHLVYRQAYVDIFHSLVLYIYTPFSH